MMLLRTAAEKDSLTHLQLSHTPVLIHHISFSESASSIKPPPPTKTNCPSGYVSWYQNCYRLVNELATWDAAEAACRKQKAHLASIDQSYDQRLRSYHGNTIIFYNTDSPVKPISYYWTDGWPVFFTQWGPGEPSNHKDEGCVSMHGSRMFHGTWNDTKCDDPKPYICKYTKGKTQKQVFVFFFFCCISFFLPSTFFLVDFRM
uniref:C-type lectin domain-containing protein n=1 Tax=Sphaeramia orbicularis TaxID=375764 RepID=A0A673AXV5_9TELE